MLVRFVEINSQIEIYFDFRKHTIVSKRATLCLLKPGHRNVL